MALISKFQKNVQSSSRPENLLKVLLRLNGLGRIWALGIKLMRLVKIAFNRLNIPGILAILTGLLASIITHVFCSVASLNEDIHN